MTYGHRKPITKEQYERAIANRGYITKEDEMDIFSDAERWGYGVYSDIAHYENGEYFVTYTMGSSCD